MNSISGLGKIERKKLAEIIRQTKGTISVTEAAEILGVASDSAAKMLARWASKGWVSRVKRGLYVPVPLESRTSDVPLEDPWLIAERLYAPCYIGGWSAAEYWDLTEQIFRTIVVMTTGKPRNRELLIKGIKFKVRTVSPKAMFGFKPVWRGKVKVMVSDPTRTVLDMLNDPIIGGGLRPTVDILLNYVKSEAKDTDLLIEYAKRLGNGAVFKRLGFLLEKYVFEEHDVIAVCRSQLTKGNAKIDPSLSAGKLITRWKLWVPDNWVKESNN
jgi:predicted transcriptional regulator of viral defense system